MEQKEVKLFGIFQLMTGELIHISGVGAGQVVFKTRKGAESSYENQLSWLEGQYGHCEVREVKYTMGAE